MANEVKITMTAKDLASGKIKGVGDQAKTSMDKLRGMRGSFLAVGAAGGAVIGALGLAVSSFAKAGDEIQKMSMRTGFSTESLSEMKFALEQSGSSIAGFEKGVRRMSGFLEDARDGLATSTDAMDKLGLTTEDFDGLNPEQAFFKLSNAVADLQDPLQKAALAQDVFGRSGTELFPMMEAGAKGIAKLREEARELGVVFDQDAADAAARLMDAQNSLSKSVDSVKFAMAEGLAPVLSGIAESLSTVVSKVSSFAEKNPVLAKTLGIIAFVLGGLLVTVGLLGIALPIMATGFGLASAAGALFTVSLWAQVAAWIALNAATGGIIIAIGAVVAGIVLLIMNWETVVRAIKIGINFMSGAIETWANFYIAAINKIIDGINKLGGIFGKEISNISELEIPRFNTAIEEAAEVVDESSEEIGKSLGEVQTDFTETADVAEDAYKRMAQAAQDGHDKQVKESIKASKGLSELFQRKRERDGKIALWDEQQAADSLALAMEQAQAIVASSNDRYAKQKEQRWQDVEDEKAANKAALEDEKAAAAASVKAEDKAADEKEKIRRRTFNQDVELLEQKLAKEMEIADIARQAQEALAAKNKEAFARLFQSVMNLPSVFSPKGAVMGIGADMSDSGTATAIGILKSKGAGATGLGGGRFSTTGITGKTVELTMNVYGNIMGEDTEDIVTEAMTAAAQRGSGI